MYICIQYDKFFVFFFQIFQCFRSTSSTSKIVKKSVRLSFLRILRSVTITMQQQAAQSSADICPFETGFDVKRQHFAPFLQLLFF